MAEAGLVGISLPESVGGGGLGFLETCIVLEEVGPRRGAGPRARRHRARRRPRSRDASAAASDLDGVADGTRIVTAALIEPVGDPFVPSTTADGDGRLTGEKVCVPAGCRRGADRGRRPTRASSSSTRRPTV